MTTRPPQTPSSTQHADRSDRLAPEAAPCASDRIRDAYVHEAMALLGEGVPAQTVEHAGLQAGMPTSPLAMLDDMSLERLDEALHRQHDHDHDQEHEHGDAHGDAHGHAHDHGPVGQDSAHAHEHGGAHDHDRVRERERDREPARHHGHPHAMPSRDQGPQMPESAVYVLEKMAHGFRRMGRAAGAGFYDYLPDEPATLWPGLSAFERGAAPIDEQDVVDRLLYAPVLESLRCLQDGASGKAQDTASDDASAALVRPAEVIARVGAARFVERADALAARYGERFRAPALLRDQVPRVGPR